MYVSRENNSGEARAREEMVLGVRRWGVCDGLIRLLVFWRERRFEIVDSGRQEDVKRRGEKNEKGGERWEVAGHAMLSEAGQSRGACRPT